jgi:uncharacterized membrane protein required for colicin V production
MLDSIGKPEIVDGAVVLATILLGLAGFWRGIIKESLITGSLTIGNLVAISWTERWATWLADNSKLGQDTARFTIIAVLVLGSAIVFGYITASIAGLPPADMPGRIGGFILGCTNAVLAISFLVPPAVALVLTTDQQATLTNTRIADWISANPDWILLAAAGVGLVLVLGGINIRRRRAAFLPTAAQRPGSSGFKIRRSQPLAPEAEKIAPGPVPTAYSSWSNAAPFTDTVPLGRVSDPSRTGDRPNALPVDPNYAGFPVGASTDESVRCISCGERISDNDRFCPRCGRLMVH